VKASGARQIIAQPPASPWRDLPAASGGATAYLSIYLSDDLARLPVRAVTLPGNNKSDPNLETMTFGLFSTCEPKLRAGAVRRGAQFLFFATNHRRRGRALTGYYKLKWWAEGSFGAQRGDFALAAEVARFTDPVPFMSIPGSVGEFVRQPFRQFRLLPEEHADKLRELLDGLPDRTADYIVEIHRLERYNAFHTGSRYSGWAESTGFSWDLAADYLGATKQAIDETVPNESPSGWWHCITCGRDSRNKALLKRCPGCGSVGTLRPAPVPAAG
jgi:hypothetical protein